MLTDTCVKDCKFWKKYKKGCPFNIETSWQNHDGNIYFLNDCTHKRSLLMTQELINMNFSNQKATEQERNAQHLAIKQLAYLAQSMAPPQIQIVDALDDAVHVDPQKLLDAPKE